jgi:hypothetical protein
MKIWHLIFTKMGWATFCAIFSQTRLVTLVSTHLRHRKIILKKLPPYTLAVFDLTAIVLYNLGGRQSRYLEVDHAARALFRLFAVLSHICFQKAAVTGE